MDLVLASRNPGKLREVRRALRGLPLRVVSLDETPFAGELPEEGETYRENAEAKARSVALALGRWALADDSGLEVEALGGEPGPRSARFLGEGAGDSQRNEALLARLRDVPPEGRGARFVCLLALARPGEETLFFEGTVEGRIAPKARGEGGFGYDPIFSLPGSGLTLAQLDLEQKLAVSHRGRALRELRRWLEGALA